MQPEIIACNADELRKKLREANLFPPSEETRIIFLKHFLDGRDRDQFVGGTTGASKTHQIICQIIAKGVNNGSPFMTLLITGKRVQAINPFEMAMAITRADAREDASNHRQKIP